jgi:hypothetical protein
MDNSDLIDELDENFGNWVAVVIRNPNQPQIPNVFVKKLANTRNLRGIYITINKPFYILQNTFSKSDINMDNVYFVDAVTKHMNEKTENKENCSFINSPSNLTTLAITIMQAAKMMQAKNSSKDTPVFIVVDSMNTFLVYNDETTVKRFFHFLISKARELGCKCLLFSTNMTEVASLNRLVGDFSDKVIEYG